MIFLFFKHTYASDDVPVITYGKYSLELVVDGSEDGWTLSNTGTFPNWLKTPENRALLDPNFEFFLEKMTHNPISGKLNITFTMPSLNECQIILEHEVFERKFKPESVENAQKRKEIWVAKLFKELRLTFEKSRESLLGKCAMKKLEEMACGDSCYETEAQFNISLMYFKVNPQKACEILSALFKNQKHEGSFKQLKKWADDGYPEAQYEFGRVVYESIGIGYMKKSANQNYPLAKEVEAHINLLEAIYNLYPIKGEIFLPIVFYIFFIFYQIFFA